MCVCVCVFVKVREREREKVQKTEAEYKRFFVVRQSLRGKGGYSFTTENYRVLKRLKSQREKGGKDTGPCAKLNDS